MSEASQSAHVRILVADYAVADATSKATLVGAGITVTGINPANGMTAAFAVFASVSFDPKFVGAAPTVQLSLEDNDGHPIQLPGHPEPLRLLASNELVQPRLAGATIPMDAVRPKIQLIMHFQNGLPLTAGRMSRVPWNFGGGPVSIRLRSPRHCA
jgi:hypothetical protein